MLGLAKDYVPIEQRDKNHIVRSKSHDAAPTKIEHQIALKFGLSKNYFTAKTKKVRLIRLLGAGNIEKGYVKYTQITDNLLQEFNKMCDILDNRIWGYKTFDHFIDQKHPYTQKLRREVDTYGITRYQKISTLHHVLKQFNTLEQIRKKSTLYIPLDQRLPLTEKFIKKYYWREKMTTKMIADELMVPEVWVQKEVTRLNMQKKKNGIKLRGKKGYVMPKEQRSSIKTNPTQEQWCRYVLEHSMYLEDGMLPVQLSVMGGVEKMSEKP